MDQDIQHELHDFKKTFDKAFEIFLDVKLKEVDAMSHDLAETLIQAKPMWVRGGKRMRPYLSHLAYQACGGKDTALSLSAGMSLEMLHVFALVHDDIIDRSTLRRGYPTLHVQLTDRHYAQSLRGSAERYGESLAILIGDLLFSFANEIVVRLACSDIIAEKIGALFYSIQQELLAGEYEDVRVTAQLDAITKQEVITIMSRKSGRYSIERPLQFGATLAGNNDVTLFEDFSRFSTPLGIAFQLKDDILGTFGDQEKLGKPVDSDIRQGKPTLMVIHALQRASQNDKALLLRVLADTEASNDEVESVRRVLIATGSRAYAEEQAKGYIQKAFIALEQLRGVDGAYLEKLKKLASFVVERSN